MNRLSKKDDSLKEVVSKYSGSKCEISLGDLSKSACSEIGEPSFVGCVCLYFEFCGRGHTRELHQSLYLCQL